MVLLRAYMYIYKQLVVGRVGICEWEYVVLYEYVDADECSFSSFCSYFTSSPSSFSVKRRFHA